MFSKLALVCVLLSMIKTQQPLRYVNDATGTETVEENGMVRIRHKVAETIPPTEEDILGNLDCFNPEVHYLRAKMENDRWIKEVEEVVRTGLEQGRRYTVEFYMYNKQYQTQFVFWRVNEKIFASVLRRVVPNPLVKYAEGVDPNWEEAVKLYRVVGEGDCFLILPEGCRYSGQSFEYFEEFCRGYDDVANHIKEDIVKISALVNSRNSNVIDSFGNPLPGVQAHVSETNTSVMNPAAVAGDVARCIKTQVRNNTIQLDCAVKGIPMDHSWAIQQLQSMANALNSQTGITNVKVDTDLLTLYYEEDLGTENNEVAVNADDFNVNQATSAV